MAKRDYYETLGVSKNASADDIKAAYRKQALKFHPDRNPGNKQAEEKFKEANEAYSVLSDSQKKNTYDQYGHAGVSSQAGRGQGGFDFGNLGDIFGSMFEDAFGFGGGRSRRRHGGQPGRDLKVEKEVTLNEVSTGVDVNLDIPNFQTCESCSGFGARSGTKLKKCPDCQGRGQIQYSQGFFSMSQTCGRCRGFGEIVEYPCGKCRGTGRVQRTRKVKVRIPKGVEERTTLRISGAGEAGERGAPTGDLYVVIRISEDERFERDGADLITDLTISFPLAVLGGNIEIPSLTGPVKLKIPAGTQPGVHFRVEGHGLPHLNSRSVGNLYVRIQVNVPKKLTKEERKLVRELAEKFGEDRISKDDSVLKRVFGS